MESRPAAIKAAYATRAAAVAANPDAAAARGALAVFLHANDFLPAASAMYEELRRDDPKEARWPYYLARILQDEGESERAGMLLEEAANLAPDYALIELRRADLLLKSGDSESAEARYLAHLARVPGSAHARLGLARIAMQKREWVGAETRLIEALQHEPDFPSARALLVSVYESLGQPGKAMRMRAAVGTAQRHREPEDPWLDALTDHCFDVEKLSVLADIALETGRIQRGLALLERSRSIEPDRARTLFEQANAKLRAGERAAALPLLNSAVRLEPMLAEAHALLAGELQAGGDLPGALAVSDTALRQNPQHAGLQRQRGTLLQAAGRRGDAEAALQRAIALDPTDVRNVETLGNFLWAAGRREQAVEHFERARALSRLAVKPRALLGAYYLDTERLVDAGKCIAEAFEVEPGLDGLEELRALLHVRMGNAHFRAGEPVRAEGAYRLALEVRADHEEALTNLVAVWLRAGRAREARDLLSDFISKNPEVTFAYSLAARVAAQAGDRNAALELVTRGIELARARQESRLEQELRSLYERLRVP